MLINGDFPVGRPEDDALGRDVFAAQLAKAFHNFSGKRSFVTALYGEWGSGKTSVKDLMLYHLRELAREAKEEPPAVVDFNPWMCASAEQITEQFFDALARKLPSADLGLNKPQAFKWLKKLGATLSGGKSIPRVAGGAVAIGTVNPVPIAVGEVIAQTMEIGAHIAEAGAALAEGQDAEVDLQTLKDSISSELKKLRRPMVVVLDDIDRLTAQEIRLVMQLVKANANFPKVVYFLLFDRDIVVKALEEATSEAGQRYLEKIVQVRLDMPRVDPEKLRAAFLEGIDGLVGDDLRIARHFNRPRLEAAYDAGLSSYLHNLRRIYGLTNSLAFHMGIFLRATSFDVDLNDLIILETWRLYESSVYRRLAEVPKSTLVSHDLFINTDRQGNTPTAAETVIQEIIGGDAHASGSELTALLVDLFPQFKGRFDPNVVSLIHGVQGVASARIANPRIFDRYFQFGVPERVEPRREINEILQSLDDRAKAVQAIFDLPRPDPATTHLDWLWQHLDNLDASQRRNLALALAIAWPQIVDAEDTEKPNATQDAAMSIIRGCQYSVEGNTGGTGFLTEVINVSSSLTFQGSFLVSQTPSPILSQAPSPIIETEEYRAGVDQWLNQIREKAEAGTLVDEPGLSYLLLLWENFGGLDEPKTWLSKFTETVHGLLIYIAAFIHQSVTTEEGRRIYTPYFDVERFERLIPARTALAKLWDIPADSISDPRLRKGYEVFREACQQWGLHHVVNLGTSTPQLTTETTAQA